MREENRAESYGRRKQKKSFARPING